MTFTFINEFIGRFHPLFVHLPIGILLIGLLFQWLSRLEKYQQLRTAVPTLMFFGAVSAAFSCLSGYLLSLSGEYEGSTLDWHMYMGLGVLLLAIALCIKVTKRLPMRVYTLLGVALFVLISATGHLGGTLTHGEGYLLNPFAAQDPAIIKKIIPDVQQAAAYEDIIQPILQNKCYQCHGPNKQKGKYRMDSPENLMQGGEDGNAIVVGNPGESELIRRIRLPKEDKHHMAPSGKTQITEGELALLHWWIEKGADANKLVHEMEQSEQIKPLLLALQSDQEEVKALPIIPEEPVQAASEQAIQKLKDVGAVVMPVAQQSHYLMVNFVMAPEAGDQEVELLKEIQEQLVWLKIGDTQITDASLAVIGSCKNLIQLQLNHTAITDKGLKFLQGLAQLQSINLMGTAVTGEGVKFLSEIKGLQSIYLYQSAVDKNEVEALRQVFATTELDTGGYVVPTLVTDTTRITY